MSETAELQREAAFLLDRLDDLDVSDMPPSLWREFAGHVHPSMARLRALLRECGHRRLDPSNDEDGRPSVVNSPTP